MSWPFSQGETKTEEGPWWSRKKVWLIAGVIAGVVLALILVIVLVVVLVSSQAASKEDEALVQHIKSMMWTRYKPCEDFYQYACGGWETSSNISNSNVRVSRISLMKEEYDKKMLGLLEKKPVSDDPVHKKKPREFYAACMDIDMVEKNKASQFLLFVSSLMSVPLLDSSWQSTEFNLQSMVKKLAPYGVSTLFYMTLVDDGFGSMIYIRNPITNIETEGYTDWVLSTLQTLGVNTDNNADIQAMFLLDKNITDMKKLFQAESHTDLSNLQDLMNAAPWLNWREFVSDVTKEIMQDSEYIEMRLFRIENMQLLASLRALVSENNYRTLANYFFMSLLRYTSALDSRFKLFPQPDDVIVSNRKKFSKRSQKCLYETTEIFPELVTIMFTEEFIPTESLSFIKEMTRTLTKAYAAVIKESKWLPEDGKISSATRAEQLNVTVGVPGYLADVHLDTAYSMIPSKEYFSSIHLSVQKRFKSAFKYLTNTNAERWLWRKYWNEKPYKLVKEEKEYEVFIDGKFILLPNEFLLSPVFDTKWRSSMKFGALGSIIGHQITHGFLNFTYWFNADSTNAPLIEAKESCLAKQYEGYSHEGTQVEFAVGYATTENACDIQGITVSYRAYRDYIKNKGSEESTLPGLGMTHDQLFFLNYAQMMCDRVPSHLIKDAISAHLFPFHIRVNGTLQNSKEFADAFGCSSGTSMNPESKCTIL